MKNIPVSLKEHILPFDWKVESIWELDCKVEQKPRIRFDYLLNLPFWSSKPNSGMLFDVTPMSVLTDPAS